MMVWWRGYDDDENEKNAIRSQKANFFLLANRKIVER